jgi:small multidrug resistance pump
VEPFPPLDRDRLPAVSVHLYRKRYIRIDMGWLLLTAAILSEVTATLALRAASDGHRGALVVVVLGYTVSLGLLALVVRHLDVSITYAVWAGAGTALVALFGVTFLGEPATAIKLASIGLIIAGVVGLNLVGGH